MTDDEKQELIWRAIKTCRGKVKLSQIMLPNKQWSWYQTELSILKCQVRCAKRNVEQWSNEYIGIPLVALFLGIDPRPPKKRWWRR